MCFDAGDQQLRVTGPLFVNGIVGDDLILGFLNLDHLPELGGLTGLALANDFGGGLEDTDQLLGNMRIAAKDPLLGLSHYLLDARHEGVQFFSQPFQGGLPHHIHRSLHPFGNLAGKSFGLSDHSPYRRQELLISLLQPFAVWSALGARYAPNFQNPELWQQNDNVPFEQSRNVPLTASRCEDAGRTPTDDPGRSRPAGDAQEGEEEADYATRGR